MLQYKKIFLGGTCNNNCIHCPPEHKKSPPVDFGTVLGGWSDDDSGTFSAYRRVTLSDDVPELRRCGAFERRSIEFRHIGNTAPAIDALEIETGR